MDRKYRKRVQSMSSDFNILKSTVIKAMEKFENSSTQSFTSTPLAKSKGALEYLIFLDGASDSKDLLEDKFNELVKDALGWAGGDYPVATKPLVRLLGSRAKTDLGYTSIVEVIGYLALWSSLLPAESMIDFVSSIDPTQQIYRPQVNVAGIAGKLKKLCFLYPLHTRLILAKSLWRSIHSGPWWQTISATAAVLDNHTGLVATVANMSEINTITASADTARVADTRDAIANIINDAGYNITPANKKAKMQNQARINRRKPTASIENFSSDTSVSSVINGLKAMSLVYSPELEHFFSKLNIGGAAENFYKAISSVGDIDTAALLANVKEIPSKYRPASPAEPLISGAIDSINSYSKAFEKDVLPKKPKNWSNFFDKAFLENVSYKKHYEYNEILSKVTSSFTDVSFHLIKNHQELLSNSLYMKNCTLGLTAALSEGTTILIQMVRNGSMYNVSFVSGVNGWYIGDQKGRTNNIIKDETIINAARLCLQELNKDFM